MTTNDRFSVISNDQKVPYVHHVHDPWHLHPELFGPKPKPTTSDDYDLPAWAFENDDDQLI